MNFIKILHSHLIITVPLISFSERVMRHKQVNVVVIAMTLPRSPGGKILWRLLREAADRYT